MKAVFFLAMLALAATASVAWARCEDGASYEHCEQEQMRMPMGSCREYMRQPPCAASAGAGGVTGWPWRWEAPGTCQELRRQCCQQLSEIMPHFRCKAVCRAFRDVRGGFFRSTELGQLGRARELAKSLPSMCNMYPTYCNVPTSGTCY